MKIEHTTVAKWVETHHSELTPRQLRVLSLRFGAMGEKVHSLEQVQSELMITEQDIRIIESEVLKIVRNKA